MNNFKQSSEVVTPIVTPEAKVLPFPISAYMQIHDCAISAQFKNLIATYGEARVMKVLGDVWKVKAS